MLDDTHNFARGTLSASGTNGAGVLDTVSIPAHRDSQNWSLDALGNWSSLTADGTTHTRSHNSQNQITAIQTETTPTYDHNGDTTKDNAGQQYTYDAWNHIHLVKDAGNTTLVTYSYDAVYRRIKEAPASGATLDLYYSASWQVVEDRQSTHSSLAYQQYVWSPVYVDALVLRDRDTNADGTADERLYGLQDANFNVTSTLSTAGSIAERYRYDPYGAVSYLDSSFGSHASAYAWQYLHQGGRLDLVSGLYCFRNRDLHTVLGRWMQEDPAGVQEDADLYEYVGSYPTSGFDYDGAFPRVPCTSTGIAFATSQCAAHGGLDHVECFRTGIRRLGHTTIIDIAVYPYCKKHGKCHLSQHQYLQSQVTRFCKAGPRSCKSLPSLIRNPCAEMKRRFNQNWQCGVARANINKECYPPLGDAVHLEEKRKAFAGALECHRMFNRCCSGDLFN